MKMSKVEFAENENIKIVFAAYCRPSVCLNYRAIKES